MDLYMFRKKQYDEKDRNTKYPSLQSDILLNYSINLEPIFDQAAVSLPSLENLEFSDQPSFVSDAGSYPAIRELLIGQFSNFLEARWLIWNSFNELEVEV